MTRMDGTFVRHLAAASAPSAGVQARGQPCARSASLLVCYRAARAAGLATGSLAHWPAGGRGPGWVAGSGTVTGSEPQWPPVTELKMPGTPALEAADGRRQNQSRGLGYGTDLDGHGSASTGS